MVALSESVIKIRLKRSLALKSYPPCNTTSLSRKPCIPDKKLPWNTVRKSWSHLQTPSWKIAWSALGVEITMTSYPACNKSTLSRKPCIPDKKLLLITIRKSWSHLQTPSWKIAWSAPGVEITMTSYPACNKSTLSRKPCIADKKLLLITIRK